jgi:hypothetical protein
MFIVSVQSFLKGEGYRKAFFDLVGKAREALPPDLTGYINTTERARIALRVAKEKATDEDWQRVINALERKE